MTKTIVNKLNEQTASDNKENFKFNVRTFGLWAIGTGLSGAVSVATLYAQKSAIAAGVAVTGTVVSGVMAYYTGKDVIRNYNEKA